MLEQYLKRKRDEGYDILIPQAIAKEVGEAPKWFAEEIGGKSPALAKKVLDSVERIEEVTRQALIKVETVNYRKYSKVMDNIRRHLSRLDAKPEHAVKKGDPELIGLVIQLYDSFTEKVYLATKDKGLLKALKPFSKNVEYAVLGDL